MSIFLSSFLAIQNAHDVAMFDRHKKGGDLAVICINGCITVNALIDNEQDSQQFEFGSLPVRQTKVAHVLGSDLSPNVFGVDYDIGQSVSINGDQKWQIQLVNDSADQVVGNEAQTTGAEVPAISNMIDITLINIGDGE